jgi:multidrug efflux pump subunit AcrB
MWLIKASLLNAYMVAALVFIIIILGIYSIANIPVDILPVFQTPAVQVLTYYQGMPTASVEKTITTRVERWTNQSMGVESVQSKSVPGVSIVRLYFRDGTDPNAALTQTSTLALGSLTYLPPNTLPPVTMPFDPTGTVPLGILTVNNPELDEAHIKDVARYDVRSMLGGVPGVVAPVVVGGKDRTVLIYLDPKKLEVRKVSPVDVVKALQDGNLMVTPGTAYFGDNQVLLDTNGMVDTVEQLNDFPIRIEPGNNLYLRDVGRAEDAYAIQTARVRIDGRQQVFVPIYRQGGASSLATANGTRKHIDYMESRLPEGTKLDFVMDQSVTVKEAIESLVEEGVIGAVLVSVMILIFLGNWRMTVIASLSIPLAILAAITCLYVTTNTINAMTLGGLALAIGPLVDDAIVALENTHRHGLLGKSTVRAALDGSVEVMVPVMVATFTTIIVLAPLALMPGMGGFLFRPLALTVAFAMLASFLLSRTFVPMMCSRFLADQHAPHGTAELPPDERIVNRDLGVVGTVMAVMDAVVAWAHRPIEHVLSALTRGYTGMLNVTLRFRLVVLGGVFALFVCALGLLPFIGQEFFPQVDAGQITVYVRAPSNARLDKSEQSIIKFEQFIQDQIPDDERVMIVSELGLNPDWSAAYSANSGQQDTVVRIQLSERRRYTAQEYAVRLRHAFQEDPRLADLRSDLRISFDTGGMVATALNYGNTTPIDIQIEGGGSDEAMQLARELQTRVAGVRGAADVHINQRLDAPFLVIDVDRVKAANVGLSARDVIMQVVAAMNSSVTINRNFWIDAKSGSQYYVAVQYAENPQERIEDLLNIFATGVKQENPVRLSSLVTTRYTSDAPVEITHESLYRTMNVQVNTENRDVGGVAADVNQVVDRLQQELREHARQLEKDYTERKKSEPADSQSLKALEKEVVQAKSLASMRVNLRGDYARMTESAWRLGGGLVMAAVLVYLLLVALFRSWVGPFIIMFTVPLGLIGVLSMLYLTHTTLNVQSEMGVIFLVGIAVNNGVLLVDFANKQRKLGASAPEAITTAARIRFRPIMMTFLATFLDLLPMAIGLGKGSEANLPLARAVVGGLLTSTCLTLFVVPILYTLLIGEPTGRERDVEAELQA